MQFTITQGDNIATLKQYPDNYFDSIVTDPPYGIEFLGKAWDNNTGAVETWQECFRVLKPGGHLLAFSAARTYHHLATNIESVGFEIRDQLMWIYASGFPKAQDIGKAIERREGKRNNNSLGIKRSINESGPKTNCPKCNKTLNGSNQSKCQDEACPLRCEMKPADNEWAGWKTALKPSHEPIVMARKPFKGSTIDNVLEWGTGALNIDATRIEYENIKDMEGAGLNWNRTGYETGGPRFIGSGDENKSIPKPEEKGQFPGTRINTQGRFPSNVLGDIPDYQKYFYCPKVSRKERHVGHEMPPAMFGDVQGCYGPDGERFAVGLDNRAKTEDKKGNGIDRVCETCGVSILRPQECKCPTKSWVRPIKTGNNHPTVKPVALMRYLIKLVTPPNGKVLDPFCGSGSTGMAAVELEHEFVGCELDPNYVAISERRIRAWNTPDPTGTTYEDLFEEQL